MVKLRIIALDTLLPEDLQKALPDEKPDCAVVGPYIIHTIRLDRLGDEHVILLNNAYCTKQIVHWACGGESVFDYVRDIRLN